MSMRSVSLQTLVDQLQVQEYPNRDVDLTVARHALAARRECLDEVRAKAPHLLEEPPFVEIMAEERALSEVCHDPR